MRDHFDLGASIYLNSGSHSICPRIVLDAVFRYQREYELNPTEGLHRAWPRLWEVQKNLAEFYHANPQDLFLRANVTAVLNSFILGVPVTLGTEILTTDLEYGAVLNICAHRAEADQLKFRQLNLPSQKKHFVDMSEDDLVSHIISQFRSETRMLILSHVMTGTGLVLPIAKLAHHTRKAGILLIVDGAHAPGAMPLDFRTLEDVDFYGGNLHKWMMAPKGTAFGWVAPRNQELIRPISAGWTTFETAEYFSNFGDGSRFQGRFLMPGCHDFAPFFALDDTLRFWRELKADIIHERIFELQSYLEAEIDRELGWPSMSPSFGPLRGPLLTYQIPPYLQKSGSSLMFQVYHEHQLQIATLFVQDQLCMRFSPHIYNNEEELVRAVQILKRL